MNIKSALSAINEKGILLVYPIDNQKEPPSLWSYFYPRSKMKWEWNDNSDNRVADLWFLREKLSSSGHVVYAKWYRGRATFFSKDIFVALLRLLNPRIDSLTIGELSNGSLSTLRILEDNSPLSTKQLKKETGLQGKFLEADYNRRLKELWNRLLIVGYGEIDDGAFPSLAMAATKLVFEEEFQKAQNLTETDALKILSKKLHTDSVFWKQIKRLTAVPS